MSQESCDKIMTRTEKLKFLIQYLKDEYRDGCTDYDRLYDFDIFKSLVNVRPPKPISKEFLEIQDDVLQDIINENGITKISDLDEIKDNIYLWKGDITTLECDAIVNAANSQMLGCFCPWHKCIDNCIHTFAGVQLRLECAEIMQKQGYLEASGKAKITSAYNLPSKFVLHTVGPIIDDVPTQTDCKMLSDCYKSCLEFAVKNELESIAFCCISTGEFRFPNQKAAEIAVSTVEDFLQKNRTIKVIFNVFKDIDYDIYKKLLR